MPNWNKIVVGNAFKLPSRNPRFYLDLMLWFPTFFTGFWFVECFHGWRMNQWDIREAALSATVLCFLLLLIKERTVLIASMLTVIIGVSFRYMFMKNPDFDPTYRKPDRENTWLGVVLVLGLVFGRFCRDLSRLAIRP